MPLLAYDFPNFKHHPLRKRESRPRRRYRFRFQHQLWCHRHHILRYLPQYLHHRHANPLLRHRRNLSNHHQRTRYPHHSLRALCPAKTARGVYHRLGLQISMSRAQLPLPQPKPSRPQPAPGQRNVRKR
ncbi:hypothetical protein BDR05DRAFT_645869 [Suillus weaverae]|nr:hypothetical protein BDR05DRAFT_645869 [Suillus weaverae]